MIIVTGSIAYDYIMEFPGQFGDHILPEHIHNVNLSFIVNKFAKRRGGTAGNVSYTMGLLKTPHILFSYVGNDADTYKKEFKKLGIDVSYVKVDTTEHTATGFAMTDTSNNQIWGFYYGASSKSSSLKLKTVLPYGKTDKDDVVLIGPQGAEGSMHFVNECISNNIQFMLDPGFILTQVSDKELTRGVQHASYLIGNEYELQLMRQRVKGFDTITKGKVVITTLGEKGTQIASFGKTYGIGIAKPTKVVDPTGAGDAWRGGFLAGLQRGFDMQICGQMGAVAASFAIENYGTQEHKFTVKEFENRYRQNFGSVLTL